MKTVVSRTEVCRDYAHLRISLTRSLNIPARMVVGYLCQAEPMDLHAWLEAFVGGAGSLSMEPTRVLAVIASLSVMDVTQRSSR